MSGQEFAPLLLENAKVAMVPGDVFGSERRPLYPYVLCKQL